MGCEQWREVLSAQLDGEESAAERVAAEAHLDGCGDCRRWFDQAAQVTRRVRLSIAIPDHDLTDRVLAAAALPGPRRLRDRLRDRLVVALRATLGLLGALQLVLGLAQVGRGPAPGHARLAGDFIPGHLWHESAAWNVAVGAGFLFVATRRTPPTGLLPMLSAFVGTLILLSVNDLVTGQVDPARLVSHGFLLTGYAIVAVLSRPRLRPDGPDRGGRIDRPGERPGWRLPAEPEQPAPPPLRLLPPPYPGSASLTDRRAA